MALAVNGVAATKAAAAALAKNSRRSAAMAVEARSAEGVTKAETAL